MQENGSGHLSLSSFLPRRATNMPPAPSAYATTTLVSSALAQRSHRGAYSLSNGLNSNSHKSDSGSNCSYTHHDLGSPISHF